MNLEREYKEYHSGWNRIVKLVAITIVFLLLCAHAFCTTIHVETTGNDATGTGTSINPYLTIYKASTVAVSGDLISIGIGHFTENTQMNIATGVNTTGVDSSETFITSSYVGADNFYDYLINLNSTSEGTNGNQYIRNITFDGNNLTATRCIYIHCRSNVEISYCSFNHFIAAAVLWRGSSGSYGTQPTTYAYNNSFLHCTINDCAGTHASYGGALLMGGTDSLQIKYCHMVDTSRSQGNNGNIIGGVEGYNRGIKILYDTTWKPLNDVGNNYNAHYEFWQTMGGMEIAYSQFNGGGYMIDEGAGAGTTHTNGNYSYSWNVHDNTFQSTKTPVSAGLGSIGVTNEAVYSKAQVIHNKFINIGSPVTFIIGYFSNAKLDSCIVAGNLFLNCGYSDNGIGSNAEIYLANYYTGSPHSYNDTISNTQIYNNTFINKVAGVNRSGIVLLSDTTLSTIIGTKIYNNIFDSCATSSAFLTFWENQTQSTLGLIDTVYLSNNIIYQNANSNAALYRTGVGTRTSSNARLKSTNNQVNVNPLLISSTDFRLQSTSPAINTGIYVGYGSDIGAYLFSTGTFKSYGNRKIK